MDSGASFQCGFCDGSPVPGLKLDGSAGCCCSYHSGCWANSVPPGLVLSEAPIQAPDSILDLESLERQGNSLKLQKQMKQEVFHGVPLKPSDVHRYDFRADLQWAEVCPSSGLSAPLLQQQLPCHTKDQAKD